MSKIFDGVTSTTSKAFWWVGGRGSFSAIGTLGGGNLSLLYRTDESDAFRAATDANADFSLQQIALLPVEQNFEMPACEMQLVLASASGANLTVEINQIQWSA